MDADRIEVMAARLDRLERENRRWRRGGAALLIALAALTAGGVARLPRLRAQDPPPRMKDPSVEIAERRLAVSRKALETIDATMAIGAPVFNQVGDVYVWSYSMLGDQIYLSMGADETRVEDPEVFLAVSKARANPARLAAFEAHFKRMQKWEDRLRPLARNGTMSNLDFLKLQSNRLQAELLLERERVKEPQR